MAAEISGDNNFDEPIAVVGESWTAPETMRTHAGILLDGNEDFFVPPPEEIGGVTSAYSTLKVGKNGSPMRSFGVPLIAFIIAAALTTPLIMSLEPPRAGGIALVLALPSLAAVAAWSIFRFKHTATYVGELGVVRYVCEGMRDSIRKREIFLFSNADELRTSATMNYTNGIYTGTKWQHDYTTTEGRRVLRLGGTHRSKTDEPGNPGHEVYFARAADVSWSIWLLRDAIEQFETAGHYDFRVGKKDWVRLSDGHMTFHLGEKVVEMDREDLANVQMNNGVMEFQQVGAKKGWFSSKGIFQFDFNQIANARLFLMILDKMMGVRL